MRKIILYLRVNLQNGISRPEIMQNAGFVQNGEISHVFLFFELGRIAIEHFRFGEGKRLLGMRDRENQFKLTFPNFFLNVFHRDMNNESIVFVSTQLLNELR